MKINNILKSKINIDNNPISDSIITDKNINLINNNISEVLTRNSSYINISPNIVTSISKIGVKYQANAQYLLANMSNQYKMFTEMMKDLNDNDFFSEILDE